MVTVEFCNNYMEEAEKELLNLLDQHIQDKTVQSFIEDAIVEAESELKVEPEKLAASVQVPLKIFGSHFPPSLKSCRVFVLRAGTEFKAERHPNSHQRVRSLKGSGQIRIFEEGGYYIVFLQSALTASIQERWISVKDSIWHQPIAGEKNWAMLAFHTVSENSLIDEYKN